MSICIFGDSIAWGSWDPEGGGWVTRLRKNLETKGSLAEIFNCGIPGDTTNELINRFSTEATARNPTILFFQIGINDSCYDIIKNSNITPLEKFKKNIDRIIKFSSKYTSHIVFLSLSRVNEKQINPTPWDSNLLYYNKEVLKYNETLTNICQDNKIDLINTYELLSIEDLADGLHPNALGHKKIESKIIKYLKLNKYL